MADWLGGPVPGKSSFRSGFLLRLFFAYRMAPGEVRSLVQDYRRVIQSQRDEFEAITDKLKSMATPEARAGWLIALHGLRTAQARLAWTEEVEALLGEDLP